uniref:Uncharacterized protein n=1 Tax=Ditylenchus dipsaci TaxID=166011 RepID=A0A915CP85_9BILA
MCSIGIGEGKKSRILQKAHISASRTNQSQKKPVYVFGSSTPRELSYLEKLTNDQKACNSNRLSAAPTNQHTSMERLAPRSSTPVRTFSRIVPVSLTQKKYPPSTAMTRSVFGTLNNNNNTDHHPATKVAAAKTPLKVGVVKEQVVLHNNKKTSCCYQATNSNQGTQELPKSGTNATAAPPKMLPPTPPNEPVKKPVIRPRKAVQAEPSGDTKPTIGVDEELKKEVENGGAVLEKLETPSPPAADIVEEENSSVVIEQEVLDPPTTSAAYPAEEIELFVKQEVDQAIREVIDSNYQSDNSGSSTVSLVADAPTMVAVVVDDDKVEERQEQQLVQLDHSPVQPQKLMPEHLMNVSNTNTLTPVTQLKEDKPANNIVEKPQQALPTTDSPAKNGVGEALDIQMSKVNGESGDRISPSLNSASSPLSLQQSRTMQPWNRRSKNAKIVDSVSTKSFSARGWMGVRATQSTCSHGIDASALANDLLAQRRQKMQLQQQQANLPKNGVQEHMPGQIISPMTTTDDDHYLTSLAKHTNNNSEGKDSETDLSSGLSSPTSQSQPPEDQEQLMDTTPPVHPTHLLQNHLLQSDKC